MIKASELRIGNHIMSDREYFDEPVFGVVYQISEAGICFNYNEKGEPRGISNPLKNIIPVPLTEEWLLKFGFEESQVYEEFYEYRKGGHRIQTEGINFIWMGYGDGVELKYIHQLQNLFFSLTGKELVASI